MNSSNTLEELQAILAKTDPNKDVDRVVFSGIHTLMKSEQLACTQRIVVSWARDGKTCYSRLCYVVTLQGDCVLYVGTRDTARAMCVGWLKAKGAFSLHGGEAPKPHEVW